MNEKTRCYGILAVFWLLLLYTHALAGFLLFLAPGSLDSGQFAGTGLSQVLLFALAFFWYRVACHYRNPACTAQECVQMRDFCAGLAQSGVAALFIFSGFCVAFVGAHFGMPLPLWVQGVLLGLWVLAGILGLPWNVLVLMVSPLFLWALAPLAACYDLVAPQFAGGSHSVMAGKTIVPLVVWPIFSGLLGAHISGLRRAWEKRQPRPQVPEVLKPYIRDEDAKRKYTRYKSA